MTAPAADDGRGNEPEGGPGNEPEGGPTRATRPGTPPPDPATGPPPGAAVARGSTAAPDLAAAPDPEPTPEPPAPPLQRPAAVTDAAPRRTNPVAGTRGVPARGPGGATAAAAAASRRGRTPVAVARLGTALRRIVTSTALLVLIPVAVVLLAVATVLSAPVSLATRGPWRPVRITAFLVTYLFVDLAGLLAAAALWLRRPGAGAEARAQRTAHAFALLSRLLIVLRGAADRLFRIEVRSTPGPLPVAPDVPLIVLIRHAGLGDSFLLLQMLLTDAHLRPFAVLKGALRADPCLDVLLGRVPHCFLPPANGTAADAVAAVAGRLEAGDALVIFPEGGNFTPGRHRRAVARLRRLGQYRRAARAARLRYVLPPRDTGSLAALAAATGADVLFVGHAGLDVIGSPRAAWTFLPLRRPVRVHWWHVPAAEIPAGDAARSDWLLSQWERMDAWTAAQAVPATPHV